MEWTPPDFKRKGGCPKVFCISTIQRELDLLDVTWEEATESARDCWIWRNCIAQCASTA